MNNGRELVAMLALLLALLLTFLSGCDRRAVQVVNPELVFGERGHKPGQLLNIDGIAVYDGKIYVADVHRVQVYDEKGKYLRAIGRPGTGPGEIMEDVPGIAIDAQQRLILAGPGNYRVQVLSLNGDFIASFGGRGTDEGRFLRPQGVAVDGSGRIYVTDNGADRVQVFSPDGRFLFGFGKTGGGRGELREPDAITIHKDKVYVADEGNGRIQFFDLQGHPLGEIGRISGELAPQVLQDDDFAPSKRELRSYFRSDVEGIVFDHEGILYAANEDDGTIERFRETGERLGSFTSAAKGGLKKIQGIAVNPQGTKLYVCDQGNMRIQVFDLAAVKKR
jgi:DNA-binding beta-propeller fold protein YncE